MVLHFFSFFFLFGVAFFRSPLSLPLEDPKMVAGKRTNPIVHIMDRKVTSRKTIKYLVRYASGRVAWCDKRVVMRKINKQAKQPTYEVVKMGPPLYVPKHKEVMVMVWFQGWEKRPEMLPWNQVVPHCPFVKSRSDGPPWRLRM